MRRSNTAKELGWKSFWSAAKPTDEDNPLDQKCSSGGVAIFVRNYLGATKVFENEEAELIPARAVAAAATAPGMGKVVFYSIRIPRHRSRLEQPERGDT